MAFLKTGDKNALAPRQPQLIQTSAHQQPFDQIRQACRSLDPGLGGAREQALAGRQVHRLAIGCNPQAASRQLAAEVRHDLAGGTGNEADQAGFIHDLARDQILAFALSCRRLAFQDGRDEEALSLFVLLGGFEFKDGERVRVPGVLEQAALSIEDAEMLILQARVAAGWIDASELPQPEPEYEEDYAEDEGYDEAEAVFDTAESAGEDDSDAVEAVAETSEEDEEA